MGQHGYLQLLVYGAAIVALTPLLGRYLYVVFTGGRTWLDRVLRPTERAIYRIAGVDASRTMRWPEYAATVVAFSGVSMLALFVLQLVQHWLPLNPQALPSVPSVLAFNTAASFMTNTNWQAYSGESTMSYLTQMAGLSWQNFVSAAAGLAVALAVVRGVAGHEPPGLGNFWVDLTRGTLYVLLPFSLVGALVLVSQGVVQNLRPYDRVQLVDPSTAGTRDENAHATPVTVTGQVIAQGPVASQEMIKALGTNGGGFFSANSAHPFENPTGLTNMVQLVAILAIPAALTSTLGRFARSRRHGWAVFAAMAVLLVSGAMVTWWSESRGNPLLAGVDQRVTLSQPGGNMEGKEARFGLAASTLFATVTTAASCGAVNSMHDSYTPLGGMVPLVNIMLGEVIFGGVGAGLYGMVLFIVLTVFIAGLMVGRTPEYLGRRIEAFEVQMSVVAVLVVPAVILVLSALATVAPFGSSSLSNPGPHGLSQVLYAYSSAAGNNGSAFAGLNANTAWYNTSLGLAMLVGRFVVIVPVLALAGSLAAKTPVPVSAGTFPVDTPLFTVLLVGVVVIVGALTFFPALCLGPVLEHLVLGSGATF